MTRRTTLFAAASVLALAALAGSEIVTSSGELCAATAPPPTSFAEDILPLLKWRCASCHQPGGAGFEKTGLDLTSYAGVMKGTKFGPMVIARDPESSNLMLLLDWRASPALRMPHGQKKLSTCDRSAIRAWIREGAKNN
jgi:mono/diheme cytochrome c family protein